jgi:hypothetical protein
VRSRERRVKVKRGLFSYSAEEHLPSQNEQPIPKNGICTQVIATMTFVWSLDLRPSGRWLS